MLPHDLGRDRPRLAVRVAAGFRLAVFGRLPPWFGPGTPPRSLAEPVPVARQFDYPVGSTCDCSRARTRRCAFQWETNTAISIKSIDLDAKTYLDDRVLERTINRYVDQLASFDGSNWGNTDIQPGRTEDRVLDLVIPIGSGTDAQMSAIDRAIDRALKLTDNPVKLIVKRH